MLLSGLFCVTNILNSTCHCSFWLDHQGFVVPLKQKELGAKWENEKIWAPPLNIKVVKTLINITCCWTLVKCIRLHKITSEPLPSTKENNTQWSTTPWPQIGNSPWAISQRGTEKHFFSISHFLEKYYIFACVHKHTLHTLSVLKQWWWWHCITEWEKLIFINLIT